MEAYTLRKVTEQRYGHGLATTVERSYWEAVRPDGSRLTTGQTRKLADANAREVLALAARFRAEHEAES